jgi:dinuclear metal center YbgI/SA1388 family protein
MIDRSELLDYCDQLLDVAAWNDYAPNGLQVEGKPWIKRVITGVTACAELIEAAIDWQADAIIVHHGFFWKNEPQALTGMKYRRIARLIKHDINLLAYHLPLDAQPEFGNNAALSEQLGLECIVPFGAKRLSLAGELPAPVAVSHLGGTLEQLLGRTPLIVGPQDKAIQRIGLCTGGAQDGIVEAVQMGLDAFISGEISERTTHIAREEGIVYYAAGHHATEREGVRRLGLKLVEQFGLEVRFVDIANPV